ncbi:DUF58 domain-containing protein [Candidatus Poriferisodalis sp.]|uniref:DUF58 domain-containing protein n=1 Tax=Candidatus Poriferisodalis sp. TaxID=3101277 RepID=UPI003B02C5AF
MLTRRGWTVGVGAVAAAGAGRLFGTEEFWVLAAAGLLLICGSVAWTRTRRVRLRLQRSVQPARVHAGEQARVRLDLTNLGGHVPELQLTDPVQGTLGARLLLGPLLPAERLHTSYLAPTQRRGRFEIGPSEVDVVDPLGLARARVGAGPRTTVVVYPAIQALVPPRLARGTQALGHATDHHTLQRIGEDFYALRDYSAGDDVRRIHWPSTARRGRPMVREDEAPRRRRVTIVLDTRSAAYDEERFELAVSAAASIALAGAARRDPLRLLTTSGADTGIVTSRHGLSQLFERLADIRRSSEQSLSSALATAAATAAGAVVVVLGALAPDAARDAQALAAAWSRAPAMTVVRICTPGHAPPPIGLRTVDISSPAELRDTWAAAQTSPPSSVIQSSAMPSNAIPTNGAQA